MERGVYMKKWAFTIIVFLSVIFIIGIKNVKAENYDLSKWIDVSDFTLPNNINVDDNYVVIWKRGGNAPGGYRLIYCPKSNTNFKVYAPLTQNTNINSFPYTDYLNFMNGSSWFNLNYYQTDSDTNYYFPNSSSGSSASFSIGAGGYLVYSNINIIFGSSAEIYGTWFDTNSLEFIKFSSSYNDEYASVTIDFSDYLDSGYRYYYGYDELLMYDITEQLTNGVYNFNAYYDDTIYAKVVDSLGNVVAEGDYDINYGMLDQYSLHFHVNGVNGYSDFIKLVSDNTDYENFWSEDEDILLHYDTRVAMAFYTDEEMTREVVFDGTWCPARDLDIYIKWSNYLPMYNQNVYIADEKLKLDLTWFNWYEESSDYVVFYSSSQTLENYTFNYAKYLVNPTTTFNVHYGESITLRFGIINPDHTITILATHSFNIETWVDHNVDEETREQMQLIEQYRQTQENPNNLDAVNSFLNVISVPINFIKEILGYFWGKMNIYLKSFSITIFTVILITAVIKIIRR